MFDSHEVQMKENNIKENDFFFPCLIISWKILKKIKYKLKFVINLYIFKLFNLYFKEIK